MKRLLAIPALIYTILLIASCSQRSYQETLYDLPATSAGPMISMFDTDNLEELENAAQYIIRGFVEPGAEQFIPPRNDPNDPVGAVHLVSLTITKVYKGDLEEGSSIVYGEPYYLRNDKGKETLVYRGNYMPSIPGKEYIFFIHERFGSEEAPFFYFPINQAAGRYPVITDGKNIKAMKNRALNLGTEDSVVYRNIFIEVVSKYMKM